MSDASSAAELSDPLGIVDEDDRISFEYKTPDGLETRSRSGFVTELIQAGSHDVTQTVIVDVDGQLFEIRRGGAVLRLEDDRRRPEGHQAARSIEIEGSA